MPALHALYGMQKYCSWEQQILQYAVNINQLKADLAKARL